MHTKGARSRGETEQRLYLAYERFLSVTPHPAPFVAGRPGPPQRVPCRATSTRTSSSSPCFW